MPIRKITGSTSGLVAVAQVRSSPLNVKATVTQRNLLAITNTHIDVVKASTVVSKLVGGSRTDLEGLVRLFKEYQYIKDNSQLLITKNFFDDVAMIDLAGVYDGALFEFDQYHNEMQYIIELILLNLIATRQYFDTVSIISRPSLEPRIPRSENLFATDKQPPLLINLIRDEPIPTTDVEQHLIAAKRNFPDVANVLDYFVRVFEARILVDKDIVSEPDLIALKNFKIKVDAVNAADASRLTDGKLFTELLATVATSSLKLTKVFADITTMIDLAGVYDGAQFELDQRFLDTVNAADVKAFAITKPFAEPQSVQELKSLKFSPATRADTISEQDFSFLTPNLGRNEPITTAERIKNFGITWLKQEPVTPVERKFMSFTMHPFNDNVIMLDDSYATLLTMIYQADSIVSSEKIKFFTIGKGLKDTPIPIEYLTRIVKFFRVGNGFVDVANPIERIYKQLSKPAADTVSESDLSRILNNKSLRDTGTTTENKVFSITRRLRDSTLPIERKYLTLSKLVDADTQSLSDLAIVIRGFTVTSTDAQSLADVKTLSISKAFNDVSLMIDLAGAYDGATYSLGFQTTDDQAMLDELLISRTKGLRDVAYVGQYPYNANLITYSEDLTNAAWTESATTTANNGGNMLLYSEQINNAAAWTIVLSGASAFNTNVLSNPYDTNVTAESYNVPANAVLNFSAYQVIPNSFTVGLTYTFSVWLRPTVASTQPLTVWNGSGRLGTTAVSVSLSSPANTWTRRSVSFVANTSTMTVAIRDVGTNGATAYTTYIWGAQVNTGATVITYALTTATPVGQITSPVGADTISYLQENNTAGVGHYIATTAALFTSGVTSIVSVYANSDGQGRYLNISGGGLGSVLQTPVFDVVNGTVAVSSGTSVLKSAMIEPMGDGWFRCSAVVYPAGTGTVLFALNNTYTPGPTPVYTGQIGRGIFLWGAQLVTTTGNVYTAITPYIATTAVAIQTNVPTRSGPFERVGFNVTKPLNPEAFTQLDRDYLRLNRGAELEAVTLADENVTRPNLGKKETVSTTATPERVDFVILKTARRGVGGTLLVNTIDSNPDLDYRNSSVAITQVANSPDAVGTLDMFFLINRADREFLHSVTVTDLFRYFPGKVIYADDDVTMLDSFDYADNFRYVLTARERETVTVAENNIFTIGKGIRRTDSVLTLSDLITLALKEFDRNFINDFITAGNIADAGTRPQVYGTSETLKFSITKRLGDSFDSIDFTTASDGLTYNSSMQERDLFINTDAESFEFDKSIPEAGMFSINLLKYSEDLNNPVWSTGNLTAAVVNSANILARPDIIAPDGSTTTDKLRENAVNAYHLTWYSALGPVTTGTTQTFNIYAKAAERSFIYLQLSNQSSTLITAQAMFNLTAGTVVAGTHVVNLAQYTTGQASITSAGNGWYLCSLSATKSAGAGTSSVPAIFLATGVGVTSYLGVAGNGVYLWGAQLYNAPLSDFAYIQTTSVARSVSNEDAESINTADAETFQLTNQRSDSWTPAENASFAITRGTEFDAAFANEAKSLEPRLFINLVPGLKYGNQLKFSEDLTNGVWVNSNLQEVANQITAPNGTLTAEKLQENNTNNAAHYVYYSQLGPTSNTTQTFSLYVKAAQRSLVGIGLSNQSSSAANCYADLSSGTILLTNEAGTDYSNITSTITSVGSGWYRLSMTADKAAVNNTSVPQIIMVSGTAASYTTTYPGVVGSGIYAWGAQLNSADEPYEYTATTANTVAAYQYRVRDNDVFTGDVSNTQFGGGKSEFLRIGNAINNGTRPQVYGTSETLKFLITKPLNDAPVIDEQLNPAVQYIRSTRDGFVDSVVPGNQDVVVYQNNALTYSEQLETATSWSTSNAFVLSNVITAPDGTTTADKLAETSSVAATHAIQELSFTLASSAGVVYNVSVYAKSAGQNRYLTFSGLGIGSVGQAPTFNLDTGTVYTTSTTTYVKSVAITPAGNGWYRCSMVVVPTANNPALFYLSNTSTTLTQTTHVGVTGTGIYIWGAQITTGSTLYAYTRTTSTALVNNMLTIEPLSELEPIDVRINKRFIRHEYGNEFLYSEEFDRTVWAQNASNVTSNVIVAPDGTLTADKLTENSTNNTHSLTQDYATPALYQRYAFSVFAKAGERNIINLQLTNGLNTTQANFNLSSGAVSATSGGVNGWKVSLANMSLVDDGWYRCSITATLINDPGGQIAGVILLNNGSTTNYTGNGVSGAYLWGGQLNIGEMVEYTQTTAAAISGSVIDTNFTLTNDVITNFDSTKGILGDPTDINIVSSQGTVYTLFGNAYVDAVYFAEDYAEYTPVVRSIS